MCTTRVGDDDDDDDDDDDVGDGHDYVGDGHDSDDSELQLLVKIVYFHH